MILQLFQPFCTVAVSQEKTQVCQLSSPVFLAAFCALTSAIYCSRPAERSGEDVDIIMARLKNVKAFERFQPSLLHQICLCGFYECLEKGITREAPDGFSTQIQSRLLRVNTLKDLFLSPPASLVYRQGDIGTSWYTVLSGSLDVKVSETSCHQVRQKIKCKFW